MKVPTSAPRIFSIGMVSGATTCTSIFRARSDAATSSPMKLAPITTARFDAERLGDQRAAVGERAQIVDVRKTRARHVEPHRLGAGGEQQRIVGMASAVHELHVPPRGVDRGHASVQLQVDAVCSIEVRRSKRIGLRGRGARRDSPWKDWGDRRAPTNRRSAS